MVAFTLAGEHVDMTIVPAHPGWTAVWLMANGEFGHEPIVAWRMETRVVYRGEPGAVKPSTAELATYVVPLTALGEVNDDEYLMRPDHTYTHALDGGCFKAAEVAALLRKKE